jgi:hypothetical protein
MTDPKDIVVAALSMVGPQAGPREAWVGVGLDEVHRLRERIERGDLMLVAKVDLLSLRCDCDGASITGCNLRDIYRIIDHNNSSESKEVKP